MKSDYPNYIADLMKETVLFSEAHVSDGGIPFTALIINQEGAIIGRGVNRVQKECDPTAHAEVDAIRDACRRQRRPYLRGTILLASGEPCAMCYMAAVYAGVDEIYFAADRDEAAAHGFDYRGGYSLFRADPVQWSAPNAKKMLVDGALRPFEIFQERNLR